MLARQALLETLSGTPQLQIPNLQHVGLTTVRGTLDSVDGATGTAIAFTANGDLDIDSTANIASITTNVTDTGDVQLIGVGNTVLGNIGGVGARSRIA